MVSFLLISPRPPWDADFAGIDYGGGLCVARVLSGTLDTVRASMAKLWLTELQGRIVDRCVGLFGGYGYMWDYPIARAFANARGQRIYGGTSDIMKEIIARDIDSAA